MKILAVLIVFIGLTANAATTYTEWYVDNATGANTNSGSTATSPTLSLVSGNWTNSTCTFYKSGADLSSINNTMWASVYANGASVAAYVAKIVTVDDTADTITLSTTAKAGTAPADDVGGTSITVGGSWAGPSGSTSFPINFVSNTLTNGSGLVQGYIPCVNIKSGTTYNVTAAMTAGNAGPIRWEGYQTTVHDLGTRPEIDGGTGTSYILLTISGANQEFANIIFDRNGDSGTASGVSASAAELVLFRCVFSNMMRSGFTASGNQNILIECEAFGNNKANTAGYAGMVIGGNGLAVRCISHDNSTANAIGFIGPNSTFVRCIADSNGADGFQGSGTGFNTFLHCDSYNNGGDGLDITTVSASLLYIENCNFVKNTAYGINTSGATVAHGAIIDCGFGAGTQANGSGDIGSNIVGITVLDTFSYTADQTPWSDPANGDFKITHASAKGDGRGAFTQTASSYSGTTGYPDVGAAQHEETASAGGSWTWAQ